MIKLFKKDIKIGDKVKLILTIGKEPIGEVLEIGNNHILIRDGDGNTTRIFEIVLGGWNLIKDSKKNITESQKEPTIPIKDTNSEQNNDQIKIVKDSEEKKVLNVDQFIEQDIKIHKQQREQPANAEIEKENKPTTKNHDLDNAKAGVKIIGKISLDKITNKEYRLRQVAKDFNLTLSYIIDILEKANIKVDNNSNAKIDQVAYNIVSKNRNQSNSKTIHSVSDKPSLEVKPLGLKLTSFSQLSQLKNKIDIDVSKQVLPANAKIKRYFSQREYGFLTDNDGFDYYFRYSEIQDDILFDKMGA